MRPVSIIVPVLNEEVCLPACLKSMKDSACEIIVVDGGSSDSSVAIAEKFGARVIETGMANRGKQMNVGARAAHGEILLFFHADSLLPPGGPGAIEKVMNTPGVVGGGFSLSFFPASRFFSFLAWGANVFCRLTRMTFGDRGIFIRAEDFWRLGGYTENAIMEDVNLSDKMRRCGKIAILSEVVATSARKYEQETKLQSAYRTIWAYTAYRLGVAPEVIRAGYYGLAKKTARK